MMWLFKIIKIYYWHFQLCSPYFICPVLALSSSFSSLACLFLFCYLHSGGKAFLIPSLPCSRRAFRSAAGCSACRRSLTVPSSSLWIERMVHSATFHQTVVASSNDYGSNLVTYPASPSPSPTILWCISGCFGGWTGVCPAVNKLS